MSGIEVGTLLTIASIGAGAVQAVGQLAQGRAQARAMEYNASVDDVNAQQARLRAAEEEKRTRRDVMLRLGSAEAKRGASGVTAEGSPLDVQADAAAEGELMALDARYGGLMESRYYQQRAQQTRMEAKQTRSNALFGAIGTLVGQGLTAGRSLLGGGGTSAGALATPSGIRPGMTGGGRRYFP